MTNASMDSGENFKIFDKERQDVQDLGKIVFVFLKMATCREDRALIGLYYSETKASLITILSL